MAITTVSIRSSDDPADPRPWAELVLDPVARTVAISKINGPRAAGLMSEAQERGLEKSHPFAFSVTKPTEEHCLAITLAGGLIFVPISELPPVLYAHLAFVDPVTRNARVLRFVK